MTVLDVITETLNNNDGPLTVAIFNERHKRMYVGNATGALRWYYKTVQHQHIGNVVYRNLGQDHTNKIPALIIHLGQEVSTK